MEKLSNIEHVKNINNEPIICFNMRELAKQLENIRMKNFSKDTPKFDIEIFYFKRLSKEKTIIFLNINRNNNFVIHYEYLFINKENKKQHRRELAGNFVEEIIEKFQPINKIKMFSDNYNVSGNYTIKHLVNDNHSIRVLELNNYVINVKNLNNNKMSENFQFLEKFYPLSNNRLENISLNFNFNGKYDFFENFYYILKNLISNITKSVNLIIYYDNDLDFLKYNNNSNEINNNNNNFKYTGIITGNNLAEFKIYFINTNLKSKKLLTQEEMQIIPKEILFKFLPEFCEINFVEIMNKENSKLENDIAIFKFTKIIYNKRFYSILNSLKNVFHSNKKNVIDTRLLNYEKNNKILKNIINLINLEIFEIKTHHLQIKISTTSTHKSPLLNPTKFLFNLIQDYESVLVRKIKYEDIYHMITTKPKVSNNFNDNDSPYIKNIIKLKNYDLNSISKILSKIDGNNLLLLNDGRKFSIGGKFKTIISNTEYLLAINTIIEINKSFSRIKIFTYSDNYFLSHFHAAAEVYDENNIYVVGGMSTQELLPNFVYTPIYKIDTRDYKIERIVPNGGKSSGVIFNHKLKIYHDNSKLNYLEISDGFIIENYTGGINIINSDVKAEAKVEKNTKFSIFDLNTKKWEI
jgi:hypothetical protein